MYAICVSELFISFPSFCGRPLNRENAQFSDLEIVSSSRGHKFSVTIRLKKLCLRLLIRHCWFMWRIWQLFAENTFGTGTESRNTGYVNCPPVIFWNIVENVRVGFPNQFISDAVSSITLLRNEDLWRYNWIHCKQWYFAHISETFLTDIAARCEKTLLYLLLKTNT